MTGLSSPPNGRAPCVVCDRRPREGSLFCQPCGRSYDADLRKDVSIAAAVAWAARRARYFARRRP